MATRQNLSIFPSGFTFSSGDPVFTEFVPFEPHSEPGTVFLQESQPESRKPSDESSGSGDDPHSSSSNQTKPNSVLRRVHTKSRRGCLNCKRRRIKCPENHPHCTQCTKRGLTCEWPQIQIQQASIGGRRQEPSSVPKQLNSPNTFTMQDFRLFNHFIQNAHPTHPIGNESTWTHEVPSIAHNHDFLLHSILAMAASDIYQKHNNDAALKTSAILHRVTAIKSLNSALSKGVQNYEQGNAMLATCFTLVFQSALMEDGFPEFMSFIRGCVVVAFQMGIKQIQFIFQHGLGDNQLAIMGPFLEGAPDCDPILLEAAIESTEAIGPLCQRESEKAFHALLLKIACGSAVSSRTAYVGIMEIYALFSYTMSAEDFRSFIDPSNQIGLLLQAHLVAIQTLLDSIFKHERPCQTPDVPNQGANGWLDSIHKRMSPDMEKYCVWTRQRAEEVRISVQEQILKHMSLND